MYTNPDVFNNSTAFLRWHGINPYMNSVTRKAVFKFSISPDINQPGQLKVMARGWKFEIMRYNPSSEKRS